MQTAPDKPKPRTYHVGSAIVVAAPMPDGTWLATYPTFIAHGATEEEALLSLSAAIAGAARGVALINLRERAAGVHLTNAHELALVWAKSEAAARMFFGAPTDAAVTVIKERPETDEERARYHHNAKLFGVAYHKHTREFVQATVGARASRTARIEEIAPPATLAEALAACRDCGDDVHEGDCVRRFCRACGVECGSACSQHPSAGVRIERTPQTSNPSKGV